MKRILASTCLVLFVALVLNCGDDPKGSGPGGGNGGDPATGGAGGNGASGAAGGNGGSGAGPSCMNNGMCEPALEDCACGDCVMAPECGYCIANSMCDIEEACTCTDCAEDGFCSDPSNCTDDGVCDQFLEGCVCDDCATVMNCEGQIEDCGNGSDDNGNTLVDCDELTYCLDDPACAEVCDDTLDNNMNGEIDCLDLPYCSGSDACEAASCALAIPILVGATAGDNTAGLQGINSTCQAPGNHEIVYTYTPPAAGWAVGTLASTADLGFSVRTTCADDMTQIACADAELGGTDEVRAFDIPSTSDVTIIVDGFTPTDVGAYTFTLVYAADNTCIDDTTCSAAVGETCTCADCTMAPTCGYCIANNMCDLDEACTCNDCDTDMFCTDPLNCTDDGFCDQFLEGCQCADCTTVTNCL